MAGTGLGSLVDTRKENNMTNTIPQVGGGIGKPLNEGGFGVV